MAPQLAIDLTNLTPGWQAEGSYLHQYASMHGLGGKPFLLGKSLSKLRQGKFDLLSAEPAFLELLCVRQVQLLHQEVAPTQMLAWALLGVFY